MRLQTKVILIMSIAWIIICGIIFAYFKLVTTRNYQNLETELIQNEIDSTARAYEKMLAALSLYAQAYSQWDEAYDFMTVKDKRFIASNFTPGIYTSANIEFMMFFDTKGKFYYGGTYDSKTRSIKPIPRAIIESLYTTPDFLTHQTVPSNKVGILNTPLGLLLLVSQPTINSDGDRPSRGSLVMGYYLTDKRMESLSEVIGLNLKLFKLTDTFTNKPLQTIYQNLSRSPFQNIVLINNQIAHGYILLKSLKDHPVAILQIDIPRIVYQQGIATSYRYLIIVMTSGLLVMILTWYLLKVFILGRITSINEQISKITYDNHFKNTLSLPGHDELSSLAATINHMIELITESQARLKYLATYDSLTQLPNRVHFYELLTLAIARAHKNQRKIALMFIDMDKLKKVNDTCGHGIGDKLIQSAAHRMQRVIKSSDVIARQSGDEFLLFIEDINNENQAAETAKRLLDTFSSPFVVDDITITITLSIGISLYPTHGLTAEELIKTADNAMYKAKLLSGNQYRFYEQEASDSLA